METVDSATQELGRPLKQQISLGNCYWAAGALLERIKASGRNYTYLYGIPRGGLMAATLVQSLAFRDKFAELILLEQPDHQGNTLVIDDLVDSGKTLTPWLDQGYDVEALFRKPDSPERIAPQATKVLGWVTFPWEMREGIGAEDLVIRLLQYIEEDPTRDGLRETPKRVLKAWKDLTVGYQQDPKEILNRCFEQPHDELVILRGIEFHSTCEHHLLPFYGTAAVGYIPSKKVVGISKLARLVDCFARRLQIQERLTSQIAQAITAFLQPMGVGVVIKAKHSCMGCRGVMKPDSDMITSVTTGALRDDPRARAEFLSLVTL